MTRTVGGRRARSTATLVGKGQLTLPAAIRRTLGVEPGARIDVYPLPGRDGFSAVIRRPSRILDFAGDLAGWAPPNGPRRKDKP
jgi:bifunctional DNA-binding transcriptional regulator/antitoxin component of YhaV-PrlF toxin-antitoxin module